jgi:putative transposase
VRKKVISPEQRRRAARAVVASELCSGRAACRFLKVSRSTYRYRSREPTGQEQRLLKRLRELSEKHARHGYRRIAALLRQEGWPVGKRHVQRLRRSIGLREPPTKRKVVRPGISKGAADEGRAPGHVWSWDFISDATTRGGALRMLTILDEYPRECHVLRADRALKSSDVLEWDRADHRRARIAHLRAE